MPTGCITALVGRNGAGKSTLLQPAGGLLRAGAGELRVLDTVPGTAEARARVALLTQDKPLYPRFTVADTLTMGETAARRLARRAAPAGGRPNGRRRSCWSGRTTCACSSRRSPTRAPAARPRRP
ncbi:ATP-binding cassette domain-containing protein [Streptomyces wuyuanensis]|uniref:ATP-binding cassette domain-containing protein n=1 Tax=Streptomyces wuyuanensis TaxID=1196353 RepID=UPI003D74EC0B